MSFLDLFGEYCEGSFFPKITFLQREGGWINFFVFAATDIDIQN